ncbi:MAG: PAS domain S-box protein [Chloroflexi bacterium]|nr:PAS domain S-box protein [Chloroflexota bacterium]
MLNLHTLSDSEAIFAAIFNSSPNFMILVGQDYRVKAINQRATEIFRLSWNYDLVIGESVRSLAQIFNISDFDEEFHFQEALAGRILTKERYYKDIYLREWWFEFTYIPIRALSGEVFAVCLSFRNITRRKGIEESLLISVATNRALIEAMPDMLFRFNRDGVFVNYKASLADKLLVNRENFIGRNVSEILPPNLAEKTLEYIELTLQTGKLQIFEYQLEIEGTLRFYEARFVVSAKDEVMAIVRDLTERKQTEAALRESEERYQSVVNAMSEGVVLHDSEGTIIASNPKARQILGLPEDELTGRNSDYSGWGAIHEDGTPFPGVTHPAMVTLETSEPCIGVVMGLEQPNRPTHWVAINTAPLFQPDQTTVRGVVASFVDITRQKEMKEALRRSEGLYRALANHLPKSVVFLFDHNLRFLVARGAGLSRFGFSSAEVEGKTFYEVIPPRLRDRMLPYYQKALAGIEESFETSEQGRIYQIQTTALRNDQNEIFAGMILNSDITDLKKTEQALRESENKYRSVVDSIKEVIFQTDTEGHWTFLNPAWSEITGFSVEESLGEDFRHQIHPDDQERSLELFKPLLERKKDYCRHQIRYLTKDGRFRWIELYAHLILDESNNILGTSGLLRDITGRRLAEEALQYRLKFEELIASISTSFINVSASEIDDEINQALALIGQFCGADRSYIYLFSEDRTLLNNSHKWCEEKIEAQTQIPQNLPVASFSWAIEHLNRFKNLHITNFDLLPEEAQHIREILEINSVQSVLIVPMIYEKKPVGYLGFDTLKLKKTWYTNDIALLRVVGEIFTSAIQRKITEQVLLEERDFAQLVLNTMGDGLVTTNVAGQLQFVNPAYTHMLGYSSEELLGRNPAEFVHPEDVAQRNENYRRSISTTTGHTYEGRMIHREGRILNIMATVVPMYRENQLKGSIGVITNITHRRQREEALRQSEERLRTVVSNVPMMLFTLDKNGVITFTEGRGFQEYGREPAQVIGHLLGEVRSDAPNVAEKIHCALEGEQVNTTLPIKDKAYEFWLSPIKEEGEQVVGVIGVALDVSERLRAEKEIRQALEKEKELSNLKSSFISMASHDFRTPLTTIYSSAELLENYGHRWDDERKQKIYQRIYTAVQTMTGLLEEVLFITKSEAGKLDFNPAPLDLTDFCGGLIEEIQLSPSGAGYYFDLTIPPAPREVWVDQKLLRKVLTNLLTNAVKYSPPASTIHFELAYREEEVTFVVRDEGIGIPEEGLNHLYEVFYRATNVANIQGTGLGLVIVKKSLETHKGKIEIESKVGVGTRCTVTIPILHNTV